MPPPLHPQLIARLAGMLAIGISLPFVIDSALLVLRSVDIAAPTNTSTGMILGSILYILDQLTWHQLRYFARICWPDLLGLFVGIYWLFIGAWPITRLINWERRRA